MRDAHGIPKRRSTDLNRAHIIWNATRCAIICSKRRISAEYGGKKQITLRGEEPVEGGLET